MLNNEELAFGFARAFAQQADPLDRSAKHLDEDSDEIVNHSKQMHMDDKMRNHVDNSISK